MATISNERHLRYILLLGEGGTLVLKELLEREKQKSGKSLEVLLEPNKTILKRKIEKGVFQKVFPVNGIPDVSTWDISLLAAVVLQLFNKSLTSDECNEIRKLRDLRNDISHASSLSMDENEYDDDRKELAATLIKLSNGLARTIHDRCQTFIKEFANGPIDIHSATERLKEFSKYDDKISTEILSLTGKVGVMSDEMQELKQMLQTMISQNEDFNSLRELRQMLQAMISQNEDFHSFQVIGTKMALRGQTEALTLLAEESIIRLFRSALERSGGEKDISNLSRAVRTILEEIENHNGVEVLAVERECILISLKCKNCRGLLELLDYLAGSLFQQRCKELSKALEETYTGSFDVSAEITTATVTDLLSSLGVEHLCGDVQEEENVFDHDSRTVTFSNADQPDIPAEWTKEKAKQSTGCSNMSSLIETRVRDLRQEIVRCIKEPTIVSHLEAQSVISSEDSSRIRNLYMRDEASRAGEELLECVLNSESPGKWKSFQDALESADYHHLKELLLSNNNIDEFSAHAKTVMRLFKPYLEKIILPKEFVSELIARDVINETDNEVILAMFANKGNIYSTMVLLERMQCRVAPQKWYYVFLDVLMKKGHQNIVQEMEPDFIANPSSFMPELGPIMTCNEDCEQDSKTTPMDETQGACGSIREHIAEVSEEGDMDTNDLGAPPIPPMRHDSLNYSLDRMQGSNLKELNIKPEMTKSLNVDQTMTGESDREGDENDDDDSSSLDSDYENKEAETEALSAHKAAPLQLRKYQLELAENAILGRNTIICAETGSGKTWVALHIIQKHLQQAVNGPRKVVFMARTGALIKQQSDRFKAYLPEFQTKLITGDDDESRMLNMFVENYDILCFTPQILVNNLEENVIKSLTDFSLLILDECHHTRGDGPYSTLMRKYLVEKAQTKTEMPQVVGLTASIGVGKSRTDMEAVEYILRVCACLDVRLLSTVQRNLTELKKHINMPDEETIHLVEQKDDPCKHEIMTAMEETEDKLQDNSLMQPDMIDLMDKQPRNRESQEYNKWTVDVMKAALLKVDDYDVSRDISSCARYLNTYNSALEVNKLLLAKDVIKYLAEKHRQEGENKSKLTEMERTLYSNLQAIQKKMNVKGKSTENPNVRILSDTLRKMLEEKGDASRAMVFVKARATCRSLAKFLDNDLGNSGISASPLYGKENRGGDDGMTESQQTEILERFRGGFYKVLVCTSVGNEGIDIPDCNIVLSYEYSGDEITKIQMKGRARKKEATTITMGSEKVVEQERINAYKAAMMYRALHKVKELDPKYFNMKVTAFQKEETHKYRFKAEVEKLKKGRKSHEDFEILCGRCNTFACYVSDVRQLGHDHIVIEKDFADRITRKEHKKPKTYDGLHKKYKMFCKKCPLDWGIIGIRDGLDCMILKIINFKFKNLRTHGVSTYKKWIDMPYNVPEIKLEDLPRLLGTGEDE